MVFDAHVVDADAGVGISTGTIGVDHATDHDGRREGGGRSGRSSNANIVGTADLTGWTVSIVVAADSGGEGR